MKFKFIPTLLGLFSLLSCSSPPEIKNFNQALWMSDPKGCQDKRMSAFKDFKEDKKQLIGLSEQEIIQLLGKPDRQELYKRNQKFYYYYISNGKQCHDTNKRNGKEIYLRLSATQKITEVNIKY